MNGLTRNAAVVLTILALAMCPVASASGWGTMPSDAVAAAPAIVAAGGSSCAAAAREAEVGPFPVARLRTAVFGAASLPAPVKRGRCSRCPVGYHCTWDPKTGTCACYGRP